MSHFKIEPVGLNGAETGETTNDYANALDWSCAGFGKKVILLKNTDGANDLDYKVIISVVHGGIEYEQTMETTLVPDDVAREILNEPYARVQVQVKAHIAGSQAGWKCDFIGHPPGGRG